MIRKASVVATLLLFAACKFSAPTVSEQQYLIEKGAFPGGVPPWVATPGAGGSLGGGGVLSGGLIPQTYTRASREDLSRGVVSANQAASSAGTSQVPVALDRDKAKQSEPDSPLHRVSKVCPAVEAEVSRALLITDLPQRIREYESLTTRCPASYDLWLWLGKDYSKAGQHVKAGRCFERVLLLDASQHEAQTLLVENRKLLNSKLGANRPESEGVESLERK